MIHAALHGKVPELENMEDILTSTVFGRLRYLDPAEALIPFLETAILYDPGRTTLRHYLFGKNQDLRLYNEVSYFFWPRHSVYGEPDIILLFSNHRNGGKDFLLLIEAKYKSSKSSAGEHDQLKRYYIAVNEFLNEFYHDEIAGFSGDVGPMIYLTEMEASSEIDDTKHELQSKGKILKHPIFHLRWQHLYKFFHDIRPGKEPFKCNIIDDLISYLSAANLIDFSGLTAPTGKTLDIIGNAHPIFYKEQSVSTQKIAYFKNLPWINVKIEKNCFYRG